MYRYRRSACRAATRHDDDDDRRAPVSTFFIVLLSPSSPLFVVRRSRNHRDLIDLFSHLRSPVFYRFTANARALNSPPSSSTHLLITFARPTYETFHGEPPIMRKEAHLLLHTRLSRGRLPKECRSHGRKLGVPELSRGAPLVDSAERRTSSTVCEKARARFPRSSSRFRKLSSSFRVDERKERGETRDALYVCVALATLGCRGPVNKRKSERGRERERGRQPCPDKFARAPFFARTRRIYACAYAITYLLMLL